MLLENKISLNATKTELMYFKNKRAFRTISKFNCVKLFGTNQVKYVGIIFDDHLIFKTHNLLLNAKLKRANNLFAISRPLSKELLFEIYYG